MLHAATLGLASFAILLAVVSTIGSTGRDVARAHTPHDPASHVELSPAFASDGVGFAVIDGRIVRTADGFMSSTVIVNGVTGGPVSSIAIAPSDAQVVYATGTEGEVYRSLDGGFSFERLFVDPSAQLGPIEIAADDPATVLALAASGVAYRTSDAGASWSPIPDVGPVTAIASASTGPSRFLAGTATGQVLVSVDGAASWQPAGEVGARVTALAIAADDPQAVIAGTEPGGVHRSSDGGSSFVPRTASGVDGRNVRAATIDGVDGTIWLSTDDGALRSVDDGESFAPVDDGLSVDAEIAGQVAFAFGPIASAIDSAGQPFVALAGFDGVFVLDPAGDRWSRAETLADAITGIAVSPAFDTDRTIAVSTYVKGAYISTDGGATFTPISRGLTQESTGRSNTVLPARRLQSIEFSPDYADDQEIYSATVDKFAVSTDGGRNWREVLAAPPPAEGPKVRHFTIGVGSTVIGPAIVLGARQGPVYRSDRGGEQGTWSATVDTGSAVRSIVLSPAFAQVPELFIGNARGVLYSDDGATTFSTVNTTVRNALLAVSPEFATDRTVFAGSDDGLVVSRDAGLTWTPVTVADSTGRIAALAVSPDFATDGTVVVSIAGSGLYRSTDRGATFAPIGTDLAAFNLVVADFPRMSTAAPLRYANDGTLVGFSGSTVVVSPDGGDTWTSTRLPSYLDFDPPPPPRESDGEGDQASGSQPPATTGSAESTLPIDDPQDGGTGDRRVWFVVGAVVAVTLGLLLGTARRRR